MYVDNVGIAVQQRRQSNFCIGVTWLNLVFVFGDLFFRVAMIVSALVSVSVLL